MPRNVEIKAAVSDPSGIRRIVSSMAPAPSELVEQTDTFFVVPEGRLKVRKLANGTGELIAYARPDQPGPKSSTYTRVACEDATALVQALAQTLPIRGTVIKQREVFIIGRTRVHLDRVERLGDFLELEVVLRDDESAESGKFEALRLMSQFGLAADDLLADAYIDLLERIDQ